MPEENQPGFKVIMVTDRRLFNSDRALREESLELQSKTTAAVARFAESQSIHTSTQPALNRRTISRKTIQGGTLAEGKKINAQQHRQVEIIEIEVRNAQQVVETARKCVELGTLGFKSCLTASAENAGVVQGRIVALVKQLRVLCACGQAASSIKQLLSNNFYLTTRANY